MNIISTYREVGTYRGAAELCGTTHKTVKRAEAGGPPAREPRPRNFDAVRDVVAERVAKSRGRISAKRLLPIAKAAGYEGSPRNFRRLVAEQKALWRKDNHRGRRPAVWSPGEYLVIDWAEVAPGLFVFCAVLAFSRWRFVRFAADQKALKTLAMIAEALAAIGGVPAKVLADRMSCLKGGVVANVVVPTAQYVHFATHYLLTETTRVTAGGGYFCVPGLTSGLVLIDDERVRDLAALSVPMAGRLEQTDDPWLPFRLVDAGGAVVEAVSVYFRDLQAAGKPDTTIRSYGMDLLRWFGFLWAIDVSWSRASRIEARDFLGG